MRARIFAGWQTPVKIQAILLYKISEKCQAFFRLAVKKTEKRQGPGGWGRGGGPGGWTAAVFRGGALPESIGEQGKMRKSKRNRLETKKLLPLTFEIKVIMIEKKKRSCRKKFCMIAKRGQDDAWMMHCRQTMFSKRRVRRSRLRRSGVLRLSCAYFKKQAPEGPVGRTEGVHGIFKFIFSVRFFTAESDHLSSDAVHAGEEHCDDRFFPDFLRLGRTGLCVFAAGHGICRLGAVELHRPPGPAQRRRTVGSKQGVRERKQCVHVIQRRAA